MRTLCAIAVLLLGATSIGLADAENEFKSAGAFVDAYHKDDNLFLRLFMKGIGEGILSYHALMVVNGEDRAVFCPPDKVGIVDAQYVEILSTFLKKYPAARSRPVGVTLAFALEETFPCEKPPDRPPPAPK
jgi:hypothetical protein